MMYLLSDDTLRSFIGVVAILIGDVIWAEVKPLPRNRA